MQTKLEHVALVEISVSETNQMFRDEAELTPEALQELSDSIKEKGVIQPVLLRSNPAGTFKKYELICGERRFRASEVLGLETIPANIREMTDEEAFECQVTENLQRKDVHPLKEAKAYKYLVQKDPARNTPEELALRFGKTAHYIATRLKLNDLVPEVKKDYQAGKMSLAAALAIARLNPDDQKEVKEECGYSYNGGGYESVSEIEEFIDRSIMCNLSSAAFKKDDADLVPAAGPCTTCSFRSGANQLFADIKNKDRCFNRNCFELKKAIHLANVLTKTIEEKPDVVLLTTHNEKISAEVKAIIDEHKLKPIKEHSDFSTNSWKKNQPTIKGLWISGDQAGKMATVYSEKEAAKTEDKKSGAQQSSLKLDIARIEERTSRAKELDDDKVYNRIVEALKEHPTQKKVSTPLTNAEKTLLSFLIFDQIDHEFDEDELKKLKLPDMWDIDIDDSKEMEKFYNRMASLTVEEQTFLLRKLMVNKYCQGKNLIAKTRDAFFVRKVAESYGDIPISQFESEQSDIRFKRELNANKRISALKAEASVKKVKPKKSSKTQDQEKDEKALDEFLNMDIGNKKKGLASILPGKKKKSVPAEA